MSVTFILGYRDRDPSLLAAGLSSLRDQTWRDFDLVVVDYGSVEPYRSAVKSLVSSFPRGSYAFSDTRGWMWNRSAALNMGAHLADTEFLFFTDVDVVYPKWFAERLVQQAGLDRLICPSCFRAPQGFQGWETLQGAGSRPRWPEMKGRGLLCCSDRAWAALGGWDEQFAVWGEEDHDFALRLIRHGLIDLGESDLYAFHQWHERLIYSLPFSVQFQNLSRFHSGAAEGRRVANEGRPLGGLVSTLDRPIFQFLDPETGLLNNGVDVRFRDSVTISGLGSFVRDLVTANDELWLLPYRSPSDLDASLLNKILRRLGWRLTRRVGYSADVVQGLILTVPGLIRDYFLGAGLNGRRYLAILL